MMLIEKCFDSIGEKSPGKIFVLGACTLGAQNNKDKKVRRRTAFNEACRAYCKGRSSFFYVDIDSVVPRESIVGNGHFSRAGYYVLAQTILRQANGPFDEEVDTTSMIRRDRTELIAVRA